MYFFSYLIICAFLLVEMLVGIILDLFLSHYFIDDEEVRFHSSLSNALHSVAQTKDFGRGQRVAERCLGSARSL